MLCTFSIVALLTLGFTDLSGIEFVVIIVKHYI